LLNVVFFILNAFFKIVATATSLAEIGVYCSDHKSFRKAGFYCTTPAFQLNATDFLDRRILL